MALRIIGGDDNTSSDQKPWLEDYLDSCENDEDVVSFVTRIVPRPKGFLVETEAYLGFMFKGTSMYSHLSEALEIWQTDGCSTFPLFGMPDSNGKLIVAIDDEGEETTWLADKSGKRIKAYAQQRINLKKLSGSNPLLSDKKPPSPSHKKATRAKTQPETTTGGGQETTIAF